MVSLVIIAICGCIASLYSLFIEYKIKHNQTYAPACDMSDKVSCSKPIISPYGKLLGVSNSLVGLIFYAFIVVLAFFDATRLIFYCAIAACLVSIYLAWILYTRINTLCLICLAIYLINGALLVVSYLGL